MSTDKKIAATILAGRRLHRTSSQFQRHLLETEVIEPPIEPGVEQPHGLAAGADPFWGNPMMIRAELPGPFMIVVNRRPRTPGLLGLKYAKGPGMRLKGATRRVMAGNKKIEPEGGDESDRNPLRAVGIGKHW